VDRSSKAKNLALEKYLDTIWRVESSFEGFSVKIISRLDNEHANILAKSATQGLSLPPPPQSVLQNFKCTFVVIDGRSHPDSVFHTVKIEEHKL
jgi:hypothetical protein